MSSDDDDLEGGPQSARAGVFRIHTAVAGFRRLIVNTIGTPNDNLHLRQRLQSSRVQIGQLVKETSAKLKPVANNHEQNHPPPPVEEIANAKLAKDVQSVLREFEKAQHHLLTPEKDTIILSPSNNNNNNVGQTSSFMESMRYVVTYLLQEVILQLENEIELDDESMSMFEEREEGGMKEIEEQMNEVNEIFRDLADHLLVHEQQGITIEGIVPNTEICNTAITAQATSQLPKASRNHSSESSMTCLSLVIFGVILLIVLILLTA
nr:syntaxin-22-like isoform X1 [Ipomoea batatas]